MPETLTATVITSRLSCSLMKRSSSNLWLFSGGPVEMLRCRAKTPLVDVMAACVPPSPMTRSRRSSIHDWRMLSGKNQHESQYCSSCTACSMFHIGGTVLHWARINLITSARISVAWGGKEEGDEWRYRRSGRGGVREEVALRRPRHLGVGI